MSDDQSSHSLLPLHYEGRRIRAHVDEMGMVWWVAQDVGHVLDIQNVRQNVVVFPDDEKGVCSTYTPGGLQEVLTVNEPGLYRLIFQSRKPEAEALKRWVFHEILPTLRRTGTYTVPQAPAPPRELPLTPQGYLPPAPMPQREYKHISLHLLGVWCLLRDTQDWLTAPEVARRTGNKVDTVRKHMRYLSAIGMVEKLEAHPAHLYHVSTLADQRNPGVYHRLNHCATIIGGQTLAGLDLS